NWCGDIRILKVIVKGLIWDATNHSLVCFKRLIKKVTKLCARGIIGDHSQGNSRSYLTS
ncbi:hypothetical protein GIB67_032689, partial [Kingdonia uniflora]